MTMDFDHVPGFMIDRAIGVLERFEKEIKAEIVTLRMERNGRDWQERNRRNMKKIARDLIDRGVTNENQARLWLMEQGHRWEYAGEILSTMRKGIEADKKAAREVEIFRRWNIGQEKKTHLAREFGLSRATVERICRRLAENNGLTHHFSRAYGIPKKEKAGALHRPFPPR